MNDTTKDILSAVESAPQLYQQNQVLQANMRKTVRMFKGETLPADIRMQAELVARSNLAYYRLFQLLNSVSDADIRALLMARALMGLPWEMMRMPDGTDALAAVIAWLDQNGEKLTFKSLEG